MWSNWKAVSGVLIVFVLGALAGSLLTAVHYKDRSAAFLQRGAPAYMDLLERQLTRDLSLDPGQKQQVHDFFTANLQQRKEVQSQIQPQIRQLNIETIRQIKSVLQPRQVEQFRQNLMEFRKHLGRAALGAHALDGAGANPAATDVAPAGPTNAASGP